MVKNVRRDVVDRLVEGALDGMMLVASRETTTPAEAYSAMLTVSLRAMNAAENQGVNLEEFRDAVMRLYERLPKAN